MLSVKEAQRLLETVSWPDIPHPFLGYYLFSAIVDILYDEQTTHTGHTCSHVGGPSTAFPFFLGFCAKNL